MRAQTWTVEMETPREAAMRYLEQPAARRSRTISAQPMRGGSTSGEAAREGCDRFFKFVNTLQ